MKLGLRMFVGFWLLGFSFEAINAIGQDIHHPGMFHGHLWDGPIKIGWITAGFLAAIPLASLLVNLLFTGELDGSIFENYASEGMILLYGFGIAAGVLTPFQGILSTFGPIVKISVNAILGLTIMSIWVGFTKERTEIKLWDTSSRLPEVTSSAKIAVIQEKVRLPL